MNDKNREKRGAPRPRRDADDAPDGRERIAKRLSRAGVASRRDAEALIADGRVRVNGRLLDTPAFTVGPGDRIEIDGEPIPEVERTRLFLFHKPAGVVTTNRDPEGRRTVFDVLPQDLPRLMTVGRLDINTEGLLLLTNDGGLARVLELPQTGWLRRYRVRVHGEVDEAKLAGLKEGIAVDGVFYGAIEASLERRQGSNAWLLVGLREGKNREVKNVMAALGLEVTRLIRVSFGPFQLAELAEGEVRELKGRTLRDQLGPRLIEEAGANFDAPAGRPVASPEPKPERKDERTARPARGLPREEEGGLIRNRKRDRQDGRDRALSRLSTSAPARSGRRDDEQPAAGPRKARTANVWMAPGARPLGRKAEAGDDEKVVTVPRKPGDRKAKHDAAAKRFRPGRAERAGGSAAEAERPRREWKPRPEGDERPKRDFKPRAAGGERPGRDWKAKPPRPGRAERAEAKTTGEAPAREYRPRPKREGEAGAGGPKREWKPRQEGAGAERPKREWKPRPEGGERPKRDFKPRGDGPKREWKSRVEDAAADRPKREWKPRPEGAASKSASPRSRGEGEGQRGRFKEAGGRSGKEGRGPSSALRAPSHRERGEGSRSRPPRKGPPKGGKRG